MKKLISRVLVVVLIAGAICNSAYSRPTQTQVVSSKKRQRDEKNITLNIEKKEERVAVLADGGATPAELEEPTEELEKAVDEGRSYLERLQSSVENMTMRQKVLYGAVAGSGIVIAASYVMQGKEGNAHRALLATGGYLSTAADYVASIVPEGVKSRAVAGVTYVKSLLPNRPGWLGGKGAAGSQVTE